MLENGLLVGKKTNGFDEIGPGRLSRVGLGALLNASFDPS